MCKYTIYSYECGDPAEDHVDTRDCAEFRRTGVHCDRDNPANRDRVKVRAKTRNGLCTRCLRKGQEKEEIAAMEREFERAKEESRLEARKREEEMQRAEQKAREESLAEFEKKKAALAAETAEVERLTKEKYDQERRQQEQKHLDFMLRKSAEEAELKRQRDEQEELQKALIESLSFGDYPIEYQDEVVSHSCYVWPYPQTWKPFSLQYAIYVLTTITTDHNRQERHWWR
jgi:enabled protein